MKSDKNACDNPHVIDKETQSVIHVTAAHCNYFQQPSHICTHKYSPICWWYSHDDGRCTIKWKPNAGACLCKSVLVLLLVLGGIAIFKEKGKNPGRNKFLESISKPEPYIPHSTLIFHKKRWQTQEEEHGEWWKSVWQATISCSGLMLKTEVTKCMSQ